MNWSLFVKIEKQLEKDVGFNLTTSVLPVFNKQIQDDYNATVNDDVLKLHDDDLHEVFSTFWTVDKLEKHLKHRMYQYKHSGMMTADLSDECRTMLGRVNMVIHGTMPYTTILAKTTKIELVNNDYYIKDIKPKIVTKQLMVSLLKKYNFVSAKQLEDYIQNKIQAKAEPSEVNLNKKIVLSNRYLAIKTAVPDNALFLVKDKKRILANASYTEKGINCLQNLNAATNTVLKSIKKIIDRAYQLSNDNLKAYSNKMKHQKHIMSLSHDKLSKMFSYRYKNWALPKTP